MIRILFAVLFSTLTLAGCKKDGDNDDGSQVETGVVMAHGLIWATRNVGEPGKFVGKPEDYGGYFTQEEAQTACPDGWRLPTVPEFSSIASDDKWATQNGITGTLFGNADNYHKGFIFLPAAGRRSARESATERGTDGWYWSSTGLYAYRLHFDSDNASLGSSNDFGYSISVRCVKESNEIA